VWFPIFVRIPTAPLLRILWRQPYI
jgi:hypothetical protein